MMSENIFDIAIVGCGPAGMSAAVCSKLRNKSVVILGTSFCTRKIYQAPSIENYLGFSSIAGKDLRERFIKHIKSLSLDVEDARINSIYSMDNGYGLFSNEKSFLAKTVIIATGISQTASLPGESELIGKGVSYCATCDGPLYKGKTVAVISGIDEGEHEAKYLAELCRKVYYIPRYKNLGTLSDNIEIINSVPKAISGDERVEKVVMSDRELDVDGVFLIYDATPAERLVSGLAMDGAHIKVDRHMRTNLPGLYAAGDCTGKPYQLAKAIGEGQVAALSAVEFLSSK
jgi:thioredoxin reductase (NADPH)